MKILSFKILSAIFYSVNLCIKANRHPAIILRDLVDSQVRMKVIPPSVPRSTNTIAMPSQFPDFAFDKNNSKASITSLDAEFVKIFGSNFFKLSSILEPIEMIMICVNRQYKNVAQINAINSHGYFPLR